MFFGVHCLVRVGWCEFVGVHWLLVCIAWCALVGGSWLVYVGRRVCWCALFVGVLCLVCVGWFELVGVRWSAGGGVHCLVRAGAGQGVQP